MSQARKCCGRELMLNPYKPTVLLFNVFDKAGGFAVLISTNFSIHFALNLVHN